MRLVHVADLHFGAADADVMSAASEAILRFRAEGLIVSGDVTQRGKRVEFAAARQWVDDIGLPTLVVPGNHDTPLMNAHARATAPFARYMEYFGDLTRPLEIGLARIDPLNTARGWQMRQNWAEGTVRLSDLESAIEAEGSESPLRLLVCHHPFKSLHGARLRTSTRRGYIASRRLAASQINALLTGHVHTPHIEEVTEPGGSYLAISAGTLSMRLRRAPQSFNLIDLTADEIVVTPVVYDNQAFVAQSPESFIAKRKEPGTGGRVGKPGLNERNIR